jgi:hypothetical protein
LDTAKTRGALQSEKAQRTSQVNEPRVNEPEAILRVEDQEILLTEEDELLETDDDGRMAELEAELTKKEGN